MTRRLCKKHGKPFLYVDLGKETDPAESGKKWVVGHDINVLTVAGSRKSKHPGIHDLVVGTGAGGQGIGRYQAG